MNKKEKREFSLPLFCFIAAVILFVVSIVSLVVYCITSRDKIVGRDGYAVISLDGYTDTIYFTEKYLSGGVYTFILDDGREVRCHRDNVVIYYDEDKE